MNSFTINSLLFKINIIIIPETYKRLLLRVMKRIWRSWIPIIWWRVITISMLIQLSTWILTFNLILFYFLFLFFLLFSLGIIIKITLDRRRRHHKRVEVRMIRRNMRRISRVRIFSLSIIIRIWNILLFF